MLVKNDRIYYFIELELHDIPISQAPTINLQWRMGIIFNVNFIFIDLTCLSDPPADAYN